jgi:hypothetical protein
VPQVWIDSAAGLPSIDVVARLEGGDAPQAGPVKNANASVAKLDQPSIGEFAQRFADRFARGANQLCERLVGNSRWELSTVVRAAVPSN